MVTPVLSPHSNHIWRIHDEKVRHGFARYLAVRLETGKPNLKIQARLFRNGEQLFAGSEIPYDPAGEADLKRLGAGRRHQPWNIDDSGRVRPSDRCH